MSKEVILTGIRANNDLHMGNYFGALLPMVDMAKKQADKFEINLFVPDLHSFTTPINHSKLQEQILHNLKIFVAAGLPLDNPNIHIYRQSHISAHSELAVILNSFTGFGEMSRMTQFKEKMFFSQSHERHILAILSPIAQSKIHKIDGNDARYIVNVYRRLVEFTSPLDKFDDETIQKLKDENYVFADPTRAHSLHRAYQDRSEHRGSIPVSVGLFSYPILMAADILLYGAKYVPVGDDQTQHLEFTRDIAERMNKQFGDLFLVPEPVAKQHELFGKDQGLRIKDLVDPTKKMSKSDDSSKGVVFMGDTPDEAAAKIMNATTDSLNKSLADLDPKAQPGVHNLLVILGLLKDYQKMSEGDTKGYMYLKKSVADAVSNFLADFQAKLAQVDETPLMQKLEADEKAMNQVANQTLLRVQKAVGLRPS